MGGGRFRVVSGAAANRLRLSVGGRASRLALPENAMLCHAGAQGRCQSALLRSRKASCALQRHAGLSVYARFFEDRTVLLQCGSSETSVFARRIRGSRSCANGQVPALLSFLDVWISSHFPLVVSLVQAVFFHFLVQGLTGQAELPLYLLQDASVALKGSLQHGELETTDLFGQR